MSDWYVIVFPLRVTLPVPRWLSTPDISYESRLHKGLLKLKSGITNDLVVAGAFEIYSTLDASQPELEITFDEQSAIVIVVSIIFVAGLFPIAFTIS